MEDGAGCRCRLPPQPAEYGAEFCRRGHLPVPLQPVCCNLPVLQQPNCYPVAYLLPFSPSHARNRAHRGMRIRLKFSSDAAMEHLVEDGLRNYARPAAHTAGKKPTRTSRDLSSSSSARTVSAKACTLCVLRP